MSYIRTFDQIGIGDVGLVGGKGANLGEMTQAVIPVPPGFCLTADAYRDYISAIGADAALDKLLAGLNPDNLEEVERRSGELRDLLLAGEIPAAITNELLAHYHLLTEKQSRENRGVLAVAVRSSATAEDLPTASFAGQQDTYLNVRGESALLAHVKRCWASLWTARAVTYRARQGFPHEKVALAVVVQAMINSDVSGILFTANPVTGKRDEIVVNASWGLGEAIVSGQVNPDTYVIRKSDGMVLEREIAEKDVAVHYGPDGGTIEQPVPPEKRGQPALTDGELAELARLALRIEEHYRAPMDIEWAMASGHSYVLQARPITTLDSPSGGSPGGMPPGEFNRRMFVEIFPDPLSPAFLSVIVPLFKGMLDFTFTSLGLATPKDQQAIGVFYNQPYFSQDYIAAALKPFTPAVRDTLVSQFVNPFGRLQHGMAFEVSLPFARLVWRLTGFMLRFPSRLPGIVATYRRELAEIAELPFAETTDRQLLDRIRSMVYGPAAHLLNYDFLMIALMGITYQMLGTLLERYFGAESEEIRARLISGVTGNVTMEANKRIWDLAEIARRSPSVSDALKRTTGPELRAALESTSEGKEFLAALGRFLQEYGHREVRMDILYPTWNEDPSPVLAFVKSYLELGEGSSPYRQQERLVREREELAANVAKRLRGDWRGRLFLLPLFNWVLRNTQRHTRERDTMHFELTRLFPPFRCLLIALGQRWTSQRLLSTPDDIFFLGLEEMQEVAGKREPVIDKIRSRRAEFQASRRQPAPPLIRDGEPVDLQAEEGRRVEGQWRGIAGSPGRATGRVRVIRGPDEFDRLHSGEILVAPLTNPVWTPLFAVAGAVVTEVGGILSHGAIVAREYGIPAVMGVQGATLTLRDGQSVTVDGSKGLVFAEAE